MKVSLSIDHVTTYNCDLFVGMRLFYSMNLNRLQGKVKITTKRLIELATIDGARDLGHRRQGRLADAGQARRSDLVRATDINMAPVGDPYDAMVFLAQPGNIDIVVVDGRILRRKSQFTALDHGQVSGGRGGDHRGVAQPRGVDVIDMERARCAPIAMEDSMTMIPDRRSVLVTARPCLAPPRCRARARRRSRASRPPADLLGKVRAFLSGLEPDKRKAASFAWNGSEWRGWNYFGATGYIKPGLRLEQMSAAQKESAWDVLGAVWSPRASPRRGT